MKTTFAIAATLALLFVSEVTAADAVPNGTLECMGLAHLQPMSAQEGQAVRGKGNYAGVWGSSTANWAGQTSSNNYSAGVSWLGKPSGASANNLSIVGKFQIFGRFGR